LIWFLLALILEFVDLILMIAATNDLFFQFSFDYMYIFFIWILTVQKFTWFLRSWDNLVGLFVMLICDWLCLASIIFP
jgi:hypothetical protein